MDLLAAYFESLQLVVAAEAVRMSGAWLARSQRRYESPTQLGSGAGPYIETVDWRWEGAFEGESPFAYLAFLSDGESFYWAKSQPPLARADVSVAASGWASRSPSISFTGAVHGAYLPSIPVDLREEPPIGCSIRASAATSGVPHVVARAERVCFGVVPLPGTAIKVGRNRLWHLREDVASRLPPPLQRLMTKSRSGKVNLVDPDGDMRRGSLSFLCVDWLHGHSEEPVVFYSELDERRYETRKVEVFRDGSRGYADATNAVAGTRLGEVPLPDIDQISADPEFRARAISADESSASGHRDSAMA